MKPVTFKEHNVVYAKDQPEYQPLPVLKDQDGAVVSCWKLSFKEVLQIIFRRKLWLCMQTFNAPLQPVFLTTDKSELIAPADKNIL